MLSSTQHTHQTLESVWEWLDNSTIDSRRSAAPFYWFHLVNLLKPSTQEQHCEPNETDDQFKHDEHDDQEDREDQQSTATEGNNELLLSVLQRLTAVLDESFKNNTPVPNKRSLHSSLSQLARSSSHDPKVKKCLRHCLVSLDSVNEDEFAIVETSQLDLTESKDQTISELKSKIDQNADLEREMGQLRANKESYLCEIVSLQRSTEQTDEENSKLRSELGTTTQKLEEIEQVLIHAQQTMERMKKEIAEKEQFYVASDVIVAYSTEHFRVSESTVTRINSSGYAGCFTEPVSEGIHRLTIRNVGANVQIGVLDNAECPTSLTKPVYVSPKAAMMFNSDGSLYSAGKRLGQNSKPELGQEWSAEADLDERTLHFFIDHVQQQHYFTNIPVPLVFAITTDTKDAQIEITAWEEMNESHKAFEGTEHKLG
ncbi:hypothetical protein BLNAU_7158 [Blattamonas nauphoetae]|uniref:Uncharacterized protein n=1 Tax=Blattamonas nauphoetae TaxID=2049346 RepID=A0ABQ9Y2K4_9EUKA|nr:hypothetical protein BLNAU_7158 [Blattamonas nauphoetae]